MNWFHKFESSDVTYEMEIRDDYEERRRGLSIVNIMRYFDLSLNYIVDTDGKDTYVIFSAFSGN